jgi:O-antigen/teichoic acid export membrane protein
MNLKRIFARNILSGWLSNALSVGSALVLTPMVIRGVGSQAYGVWILINQISGYAGVLDLGVQPAVTKYVARARSVGDRDELRRLISSAISIHTGIACVVFAVLFALSFFLGRCFNLGEISPAEARRVLLIAGAGTALGFPASVLSGVLRGYLRLDLVNWLTIAVNIVRFLGVLLVLAWDRGIVGLAWVGLAANALGLVGGLVLLRWEAGEGYLRTTAVSRVACQTLLSFGVISFIGALGWYLAYTSNALVIGATLRAEDIAHFGLAMNVIVILSGLVSTIAATIMPLASECEARGDLDQIQRVYYYGTQFTLIFVLPFMLVFLIQGPDLLSLWVGPDFGLKSGRLLQILMLAHFPVIMNGPSQQIAMGAGLQRQVALMAVIQGVLILPLSYGLCRALGVEGAAIASLGVGMTVQGIVWPLYFWRKFQLTWDDFWSKSLRVPLVPLVPALLVGAFLVRILGRGTLLAGVSTALATMSIYTLIALRFILPGMPWARGRFAIRQEESA